MKKIFSVALLVLATLGLGSCKKSDDAAAATGVWTQLAHFSGLARNSSVTFTINGVAYTGLGHNTAGTDSIGAFKDFYSYTPANNSWAKVAPFPGNGRYMAVAFAANGMGYVGTGYNGRAYLADFWQYNPATNVWTRIADFPSARYGAVAFGAANKGYVGTGYNGNPQNDFYQYDPATGAWTTIASFGGAKRLGASAFTVSDIGYVMLGSSNGLNATDMYAYDPGKNVWTKRRDLIVHSASSIDGLDYDYSAVPRTNAAAFAVGANGYVALGTKSGVATDCWAYSPADDTWTLKTVFAGAGRSYPIGFGIGNYGYVSLGVTGTQSLDDLWQLDPDAVPQ